jgi:hypothetical protein
MPQTETQRPARAATSMFIGCLEKGSTPNAFVLNVLEMPGTPGSTRGTSGTTGSSGPPGHRMPLVGGTNMAAHVGHKVEITGMVVPQGSAIGRTTQTAAAGMRVNVSSVRKIDTSCPAATPTRN